MKLDSILDLVDSGDIALPEFQRGYVWNREQVRALMSSLYRGYPFGSFMTWNTRAEGASARGGPVTVDGTVKLLLDGQQRVTTLYGIIRGKPPKFFEGNTTAFTGLYFNLDEESFEFYAPVKMKDNPSWVNVTELMQHGLGAFIPSLQTLAQSDSDQLAEYMNRLNHVIQISKVDVHIEEVTGTDKTLDVVVDIFNRVNSGGTKLSKGDLALAKICASWPQARDDMNSALNRWSDAGFNFRLEWLLRNVNAVVTGEALFSALSDVPVDDVRTGLKDATNHVSYMLDAVSGRLGLDHDRVLFARYAFPVMSRYLHANGGKFPSSAERDKLLYWYIHAGMWGRFAGSTESFLNQDFAAVDADGLDGLIANMTQYRGDLLVRESDFAGYSLGARFYPILYLLTRVLSAQDFGSGVPLSANMLGHLTGLQVHHIYPKARLYEAGYERAQVNAVANFCFLTQDTNLAISADDPAEYFVRVEEQNPGALASQWIPMDESLWRVDRYSDFLAARRELLAQATNRFLDQLQSGRRADSLIGESHPLPGTQASTATFKISASEVDARDTEVASLARWIVELGYAAPDLDVEVVDPESGKQLAIAEAYWPSGLQEGLGEPVVLELDPEYADEDRLAALGFHVFTTIEGLREYVNRVNGSS